MLSLLAGCESEAEIAAEMERSLVDANQGLVGVLVATEVMHLVDATPSTTVRHSTTGCGCPCVAKVGDTPPYIVTLDYPTFGCIPDSGLIPTSLAGHTVLDADGATCDVTWDGLLLALEHEVTGDLQGEASADHVAPKGELTVGPWTATLDLDVAIAPDALTIDGDVTSTRKGDDEPRTVSYRGVRLPRETILGQCPAPDDGTAALHHPGWPDKGKEAKDVVVKFAQPGGGSVTVERDDRVSEPTDWCGYTSSLW
ncbi:MAG: hypothetical protein R3F59_34700 [Myxococcota bacterium]